MNFRTIGLGLVAVTVTILGTVANTAPAQALAIGDKLSFFGDGKLIDANVDIGEISIFDFDSAFISGSTTPDVFGSAGTPLTFADLRLEKTSGNTWTLIDNDLNPLDGIFDNFITGLSNGRVFNLSAFNLTQNADGTFSTALKGFFVPPGTPGSGQLTTQAEFAFDGDSFSGSITAVPTPALLPAALGMGVAALRKKRKQEADADLASDPVEA